MMDTDTLAADSQVGSEELAARCLSSSSYLPLRNISCVYRNGVLVLRGCVETYYLKQLAHAAVAHIEGIERIDNHIQVVSSPLRSGRDFFMPQPPSRTAGHPAAPSGVDEAPSSPLQANAYPVAPASQVDGAGSS